LFVGSDDPDFSEHARSIVSEEFTKYYFAQRAIMRKSKLGLKEWSDVNDKEIWKPLYRLLMDFDFTIFWRQLSNSNYTVESINKPDEELVRPLQQAAYTDILEDQEGRANVSRWIRKWLTECKSQGIDRPSANMMLKSNPKYIPREWMLVKAYRDAENEDFSTLHTLQQLFESPYDEHTDELQQLYYRKTPTESQGKPGVAFYS